VTEFLVVFAIALLITIPITAGIILRRRSIVRPCYRCRDVATTDYMGIHYCILCVLIVQQMMPAVRHDPPFGFPGSNGYLDFPEKKKEG
jgi:hypothetical protein